MSSSTTYNDSSNFDDFFTNNNFYSSNSSSIDNNLNSNHITNLKNSIHIKHSISSRSIKESLQPQQPEQQPQQIQSQNGLNKISHTQGQSSRTSIIKNSPSLKALENILNEKTNINTTSPSPIKNIILEVDEEDLENNPSLSPPFNYDSNLINHDVISKSSKNSSTHKYSKSSISTISESGYSTDDTPILGQPPTFQNFTPHSFESPTLKVIATGRPISKPEDSTLIDDSTNNTNDTIKQSDDSSTFPLAHTPIFNNNSYTKSEIERKKMNSNFNVSVPLSKPNSPITTTTAKSNPSMTPKQEGSTPRSRSKSMLDVVSNNDLYKPITNSTTRSSPVITSRSPHIRSKSTASVTQNQNPIKHKRSSTMDDLGKVLPLPPPPPPSKDKKSKFSFKSLFKSKSKNHSLNEEVQPKLTSKSYSTSNIPIYHNKKSANANINSFKNVFKMNKTAESLNANSTKEHPVGSGLSPTPPSSSKFPDSTNFPNKSTNIIREVSERDINVNKQQSNDDDFSSESSSEHFESPEEVDNEEDDTNFSFNQNEFDYDSKNLMNDPPTKFNNHKNNHFGEEISLNLQFGSPFKVDYKNADNNTTPRINQNSPPIFNLPEKSSSGNNLVGETLFPKSLNAQEVESIVSLERSRSMRSIKSNKRSSFVNYNGSDDNIVQYNGPGLSPNHNLGSMKRSNSILKNSKRNLNQELTKSIDDTLQTTPNGNNENNDKNDEENIQLPMTDFMEFSEFIDVDNLSFNYSPIQVNTQKDQSSSPLAPAPPMPNFQPSIIIHNQDTPEIKQVDQSKTPSPSPISMERKNSNSPKTSIEIEETIVSIKPMDSPLASVYQDEKLNSKNRPVSMSFKGLNAPSFSGKMSQQHLRSSDSHQSFTISFNDSSSSIGGGFGTTSDEEEELEEGEEDEGEEDEEEDGSDFEQGLLNEYDKENEDPKQFIEKPPNPSFQRKFNHNKIPSISDQSSIGSASSPKSFTSMFSNKWYSKKTPQQHFQPQPRPAPPPPTKSGGVRFSSRIILYDTYNEEEYDRHPDTATCNQLTPSLAQQIKEEMNEFKSNMNIHVESRCYTQFF